MTLIRISSLRWAGHVERTCGEDILKRIIASQKEEGDLEDLNVDGSMEYWRIQ